MTTVFNEITTNIVEVFTKIDDLVYKFSDKVL